jgi:hypothetical protein
MDSTILGVLGLVGSIASLMGIGLYQLFFRDTPLRMLIVATTVFGALIGSTGIILYTHYNRQLGIPDKVFLITDNVVVSAVGQISQMPVTSASMRLPSARTMAHRAHARVRARTRALDTRARAPERPPALVLAPLHVCAACKPACGPPAERCGL